MIAIGCDHGGYKLKEEIKKYLEETGIEYDDCGCNSEESVNYPDIAKNVAKKVSTKECEKGILICRSGIGMSIVANKFKNVRCAKVNSEEEAKCIFRIWIATEFEGGRHQTRVDIINDIENENMK